MPIVIPANPGFNFLHLLAEAASLQDRNENNPDLFSLSPLSSASSDASLEDPPETQLDLLLPPSVPESDRNENNPDLFSLSPLSSASSDAPLEDPPETQLDLLPPPLVPESELLSSAQASSVPLIASSNPPGAFFDHPPIRPEMRTKTNPTPDATIALQVAEDVPPIGAKRKRNKEHSKANRKRRRMEEKSNAPYAHYEVRATTTKRYVDRAEPISCALNLQDIEVTSTGFVGKDDGSRAKKKLTLQYVLDTLGFTLQKWDRIKSIPVLDKTRRMIALLAGCPDDPDWTQMQREAADALEEKRPECCMPKPKKTTSRWGNFVSLSCGVSHGGGQGQPSNLRHTGANAKVLGELNKMRVFRRLAGFVLAVVATWAPLLHKHYVDKLGRLHRECPDLEHVFNSGLFSAYTYNFGPQTVCFKHKDFGNLPYGWCAITSFGDYDCTKGGHLILWECRLVIEFPPGSTILIPSAAIFHSNTTILPHEHRYSFAQYSAGGLFRWVENGFQKTQVFYDGLSPEEKILYHTRNTERWTYGLNLLPVIPEDVVQLN